MNPVTQATEYNRMFGELVALESHRRSLREQAHRQHDLTGADRRVHQSSS